MTNEPDVVNGPAETMLWSVVRGRACVAAVIMVYPDRVVTAIALGAILATKFLSTNERELVPLVGETPCHVTPVFDAWAEPAAFPDLDAALTWATALKDEYLAEGWDDFPSDPTSADNREETNSMMTTNRTRDALDEVRDFIAGVETKRSELVRKREEISLQVVRGSVAATAECKQIDGEIMRCDQELVIGRTALKQAESLSADRVIEQMMQARRKLEVMLGEFEVAYRRALERARKERTAESCREAYMACRRLYSLSHDLKSLSGDPRRVRHGFSVKNDLGELADLIRDCFLPHVAKPLVGAEWRELLKVARGETVPAA